MIVNKGGGQRVAGIPDKYQYFFNQKPFITSRGTKVFKYDDEKGIIIQQCPSHRTRNRQKFQLVYTTPKYSKRRYRFVSSSLERIIVMWETLQKQRPLIQSNEEWTTFKTSILCRNFDTTINTGKLGMFPKDNYGYWEASRKRGCHSKKKMHGERTRLLFSRGYGNSSGHGEKKEYSDSSIYSANYGIYENKVVSLFIAYCISYVPKKEWHKLNSKGQRGVDPTFITLTNLQTFVGKYGIPVNEIAEKLGLEEKELPIHQN